MDDANTIHLPVGIILIILSKLSSVKSLLRFKSVSKSWNRLISDPTFARNHHRRSKDSTSQTLFLSKRSKINSEGFCLVKLDDRKLDSIRVLGAPYGWEDVACFCNGVLLLTQIVRYRSIALWNPSTGEVKRLSLHDGCYPWNYGLCRDPTTDDSKVVILSWDFYYTVYSFMKNSWQKRTKYICDVYALPNQTGGVCVDGASYWAWSNGCVTQILYFDPRDDKFKILQKPENFVYDIKEIYLVDLGGCLCLYCNGRDEKTVRIWRKGKGMDSNSWETLMDVENVDVGMSIRSFQPQGFVRNKIVIRHKFFDRLVVYNPYEKRFEKFEDTEVFGVGLVPYVDT